MNFYEREKRGFLPYYNTQDKIYKKEQFKRKHIDAPLLKNSAASMDTGKSLVPEVNKPHEEGTSAYCNY